MRTLRNQRPEAGTTAEEESDKKKKSERVGAEQVERPLKLVVPTMDFILKSIEGKIMRARRNRKRL